MTEQYSSN